MRVSARARGIALSVRRPCCAARVCRDGGCGADRDPILIAGRVGARVMLSGVCRARGLESQAGPGWARDGVDSHGMEMVIKCPPFFSAILGSWER